MSETEQELVEIKEIITQLKQEAIDKQLFTKLKTIAEVLGSHSDYGGGQYFFCESGLSILYNYHIHDHIKVDLGYDTKDVYRCSVKYPNKEDVYLYISGEWEKRIEILLQKCPQVKEERKQKSLQRKINELKTNWRL